MLTALLNEECRSWFSLIECEMSKACGTQAVGHFLKHSVGNFFFIVAPCIL